MEMHTADNTAATKTEGKEVIARETNIEKQTKWQYAIKRKHAYL
jgi:hypothetical protein